MSEDAKLDDASKSDELSDAAQPPVARQSSNRYPHGRWTFSLSSLVAAVVCAAVWFGLLRAGTAVAIVGGTLFYVTLMRFSAAMKHHADDEGTRQPHNVTEELFRQAFLVLSAVVLAAICAFFTFAVIIVVALVLAPAGNEVGESIQSGALTIASLVGIAVFAMLLVRHHPSDGSK